MFGVDVSGAEQALKESQTMLAESQRIIGATMAEVIHGPYMTGENSPYQVAVCF